MEGSGDRRQPQQPPAGQGLGDRRPRHHSSPPEIVKNRTAKLTEATIVAVREDVGVGAVWTCDVGSGDVASSASDLPSAKQRHRCTER